MNDWILLLGKRSSFIISKSEIQHFYPFWSVFSILINGLYSFKADLTPFSTLSRHLRFYLSYICILKECFKQNWMYGLLLLEYVDGKLQICYQCVFCNTVWVLMHSVLMNWFHASVSINATVYHFSKIHDIRNETSRVDNTDNQHCIKCIMIIRTVDIYFW